MTPALYLSIGCLFGVVLGYLLAGQRRARRAASYEVKGVWRGGDEY